MQKSMTCSEFDETLWGEGFYSEIHSEMYWDGGYNPERLFKAFKDEAEKRKITLTDLETWDYDKVFHNNYKSDSDKGLS